jgi:hypothetical protein
MAHANITNAFCDWRHTHGATSMRSARSAGMSLGARARGAVVSSLLSTTTRGAWGAEARCDFGSTCWAWWRARLAPSLLERSRTRPGLGQLRPATSSRAESRSLGRRGRSRAGAEVDSSQANRNSLRSGTRRAPLGGSSGGSGAGGEPPSSRGGSALPSGTSGRCTTLSSLELGTTTASPRAATFHLKGNGPHEIGLSAKRGQWSPHGSPHGP